MGTALSRILHIVLNHERRPSIMQSSMTETKTSSKKDMQTHTTEIILEGITAKKSVVGGRGLHINRSQNAQNGAPRFVAGIPESPKQQKITVTAKDTDLGNSLIGVQNSYIDESTNNAPAQNNTMAQLGEMVPDASSSTVAQTVGSERSLEIELNGVQANNSVIGGERLHIDRTNQPGGRNFVQGLPESAKHQKLKVKASGSTLGESPKIGLRDAYIDQATQDDEHDEPDLT